tara:strand:- start:162 stop:455 length:294 start_codon:yes stop_codon:yes gene_type:complete
MNQAEKISYILETILNCDEYIVPPNSESFFDIIWVKDTKKCSESDFNSALAEYEANQYQRDRAESYDPIPEQLDQIYHDMDGWKAKIKAVKDKYPKP